MTARQARPSGHPGPGRWRHVAVRIRPRRYIKHARLPYPAIRDARDSTRWYTECVVPPADDGGFLPIAVQAPGASKQTALQSSRPGKSRRAHELTCPVSTKVR